MSEETPASRSATPAQPHVENALARATALRARKWHPGP
jgi:hypothetical protein